VNLFGKNHQDVYVNWPFTEVIVVDGSIEYFSTVLLIQLE
jgi:hypothetical protein